MHTIKKSTSCSDRALASSVNLSFTVLSDTAAGSWFTSFNGCKDTTFFENVPGSTT